MRMKTTRNRDDENWRVHSLAKVDGAKVTLATRPVHLDPLTSEKEGGIEMKNSARSKNRRGKGWPGRRGPCPC